MDRAAWLRRALPALLLATAVLVLGLGVQARVTPVLSPTDVQLISLLAAAAVALAWRWQAAALAVVWMLLALHAATASLFLPTEAAIAYVAFACAAWGSRATLVASLVSIPLAAVLGAQIVVGVRTQDPDTFSLWLSGLGLRDVALSAQNSALGPSIAAGVAGLLALVVPWLIGLAVRLVRRSAASLETAQRAEADRAEAEAEAASAQAERAVAEEVAHVREAQAQLARDVHDVVGHSLTVILAQAEAGAYQSDAEAVKRTLATITDTARASLADVRQVLHSTGPVPIVPVEQDLHDLLDGVRASGRTVHLQDVGEARTLPPERAAAAHRVLQEMLTNAVRHGAPGAITLTRHWGAELRLEVTNATLDADEAAAAPTIALSGRGLDGMRRRLEAVGGRLEVHRSGPPSTFTATAWIPLPGRLEEPMHV